jgi:hypothetical protein
MNEVARYECFAPGFEGERTVSRFWLLGSLKSIERRAKRENDPDGHKPSGFETMLAIAIAVSAIALVATLL